MAQTTSTMQADLLFTELLAMEALASASPRPIALQFFNKYDIAGKRTKNFKLNEYTDIGPATTGTEGTTFSTVTSMAVESPLIVTPTEAAVMLAQLTDDSQELVGGYESVAEVMAYGTLQQQLAVLKPTAERMVKAAMEKAEVDAVALFAGASTSVGTTTVDLDLGVMEEAIFNLDIAEAPDREYVALLHPRQVSDLRRALAVTSGGVNSNYHAGKSVDHMDIPNGFQFDVLGIPVFQYDYSAQLTANAGADVVGSMFVPGYGSPELGGGGKVGAYAFVQGRGMNFRVSYELRDRASDIMVNWKYAAAERKDAWTVKIVTDA